jgi:hypothetical protein
MDRREFLAVVGTASLVAAGSATGAVSPDDHSGRGQEGTSNNESGIPSADQLAGQWFSFGDLHTLPTINSFMGGCQVGSDLLSIEALTFPAFCQGGNSGALSVDGNVLLAAAFQWFPYQVLRKAHTWDGNVELLSAVRMSHTQRAVMFRISVTNHGKTNRKVHLQAPLTGMIRWITDGWSWFIPRPQNSAEFTATVTDNGHVLLIHDTHSAAQVGFAFSALRPAALTASADHGVAQWDIALQAGETRAVEIVMTVGLTEADVAAQAAQLGIHFNAAFAAAKDEWQNTFNAAFEPGNKIFSGHLPTLRTADPDIRRVYYMSVVSLLAMVRGCFPTAHRAYITGSPQCAASLMYFWDTFTWATLHALLDPVNMKNMLRRWLELNIHSCYAQDMITGHGVGPWYSFNDFVVFNQFLTYIKTTGDTEFLNEMIGGRAVIEQLEQMSLWWKRLVKPYSPLADYGGRSNLLECVPTYTHVVASLNAANVWMMRQTAELRHHAGQPAQAAALSRQAARLAADVLTLYVPGRGYWYTIHPDGQHIPVRHCIDFFTVAYCMEQDLTATMKREMTQFVAGELLTTHWMRALSLNDPAAPESNRPDHGPMGAYDAWPPFTMEALCRLGKWTIAAEFLKRCAYTTREGPFGQSHELLTAHRDSPVRKAYRGGQMYNCSCSGAFAEIIIRNFFGFQCDHNGAVALYSPGTDRGFTGTLTHVRAKEKSWTIHSGAKGLVLTEEGDAAM